MLKKPFLIRFFGHLHTINKHKFKVTMLCLRCGLIKQGLLHDLSKYSYIEFSSGVKYWQGWRSPIDAEREDKGYSLGWLHHEGRNKHHWEYWIDKDYINDVLITHPMPLNYLIESVLDRIGASKVYNKNYDIGSPLEFFENGKDKKFMGDENTRRYRVLLTYLKYNGEEKALQFYKELYEQWKKDNSFNI